MKKELRLVITLIVSVLVCYLIYKITLLLSNWSLDKSDDNNDLHGFLNVLFGLYLTPILAYISRSIKTKNWRFDTEGNQVSLSNDSSSSGRSQFSSGLSILQTLSLLSILWALAAAYCQLLFASVYEAATDPNLIGVNLSPVIAAKMQNTIRGTLYFGSYIPIVAGSSFVSAFFCKQRISFRLLLIPATLMYLAINIWAIQNSGQPTVLLAAKHLFATSSLNLATQGLIWLVAFGIFTFTVVIIAIFSWLWAMFGLLIKNNTSRLRLS